MHAIKSHVITQDQLHVHLRTAEQSQPMQHDTSSFLLHGGGWWFSRCVLFDFLVTPWTAARQAPRPWYSPGKNTWMGCHALLQGVFLTQGSDPCLLHCRWVSCLASGFFTTEPPAVKKGSPFFFRKTSKRNRASFHPPMSLCPPRLFQTVTWTLSKFQSHVQSYSTLCVPERRADISQHGPQCPATSAGAFLITPT